jgi:hypothetical protein
MFVAWLLVLLSAVLPQATLKKGGTISTTMTNLRAVVAPVVVCAMVCTCLWTHRWRKYGVVLLWAAVGLDLLISKMGYPILGQCLSIVCVLLYLFENISLRKAVCSFWFGMMDLYFREISIGGQHKILPINDGRAVIFAWCVGGQNLYII